MKMQSLRLIAATWALLLLVACGGGGSVSREENTGGSTPDPSYSVSLTLADSDGNTSTSLTGDSPLILSATVTDSDGSPVANTVVTFSFTVANLARFSNDTGTALTNDEGVATITLIVGELSGSGAVERRRWKPVRRPELALVPVAPRPQWKHPNPLNCLPVSHSCPQAVQMKSKSGQW